MDHNPSKTTYHHLPVHQPDKDLWQRIEAALDPETQSAIELPAHHPDPGTWAAIENRLNRALLFRRLAIASLSAAAILLIGLFVVKPFNQTPLPQPATASKVPTEVSPYQHLANHPATPANNLVAPERHSQPKIVQPHIPLDASLNTPIIDPTVTLATATMPVPAQKVETTTQIIAEIPIDTPAKAFPLEPTDAPIAVKAPPPSSIPLSQNTDISGQKKYYSPDEQGKGRVSNVALGLQYFPEPVYNGSENSIFHNVDLSATYQNEKSKFSSSFGIAYNDMSYTMNVNYDKPVTMMSVSPDGTAVILSQRIANFDQVMSLRESHEYFTYSFNYARRIFAFHQFSAWWNAGAGMSFILNPNDAVEPLSGKLNYPIDGNIQSIASSLPVYNRNTVNFATGIDLSYKLSKKLSFTISPTSRWYFKPIWLRENLPTDELTLGFKSGIRYDF